MARYSKMLSKHNGPRHDPARRLSWAYLRDSQHWISTARFHLYTLYLTCASNVGDIVLSGIMFSAVNSSIAPLHGMGHALSIHQILLRVPHMLLWSFSNLFLFCLHNQKRPETIIEDRMNKPWRPIPSGRLTERQASGLLYLMHPLCLLIAWSLRSFIPYVVLTSFHLWYNELGGASNGVLKNIHNAVGIICFFTGPLEVATQHSILDANSNFKAWLITLTAIFATTCHTQDFRDMSGDRAAGRQTIPLMLGDVPCRVLTAVAVVIWTVAARVLWGQEWQLMVCADVSGLVLIANLLLNRTTKADILSWKLWSVWVFGLIIIPCLKVGRDSNH
ncbi:UbiA prenyltransferase family [Xylariaceae sp. FL1019]|nr:UbiA prenyltransferase family [Xylariaceae sp. FL1019]